jgi:pimeloyl-[acyl-carrier protein] methyl ester esterase
MAGLHVDRYEYAGSGSGAPLLLIHGWGMHGGMWSGVAERLAQNFSVMAVDLPGHGYSVDSRRKSQDTRDKAEASAFSYGLDGIVDELSGQFNEPLTLCGWSLGGQIALCWAKRHPEQVRRLLLVASTPCFVSKDDWPCAMPVETLAEFGEALQQDYRQTLRRFLALQLRGSEHERELLAALRGALFSHGEPDLGALQSGLAILRDCDLRSALPDIRQPVLVIAGERDMLTPPQASHYLASHLPDARLAMIRGAAHAPFLSHTAEFAEHVMNFLNEQKHG